MRYVQSMQEKMDAIANGQCPDATKIIPFRFNRFVDYHATRLKYGQKELQGTPTLDTEVTELSLNDIIALFLKVTDIQKDEVMILLGAITERDSEPKYYLRKSDNIAAINIVENKADHLYFFNKNLL